MAATQVRLDVQSQPSASPQSILITDASSKPSYFAPTTGADRLLMYDDSANAWASATLGTNLSFSGTTLNATAGAGGYTTIQEEGSTVGSGNSTINFIGGGITAANVGGGVTSVTIDATLNALAAYNTNGILTQTAADTFVGRTLTGTTNKVDVSNGDGVSGNPTITISPTYVGQTSITTLGTIATGTWNSTVIGPVYGGTGLSSYTLGDLIYSSATNTLAKLAGNTTTTKQFLSQTGNGSVSAAPVWSTIAETDIVDGTLLARVGANETISGTWAFSNNITMNGTPSASTDVVTVGYVSSLIAGIRKGSVRAATTTNGTLASSFANGSVIDTVTLATGDIILLKNQTSQAENGIYTVNASGAPTRVTWMDAASEVDGVMVIIEDGSQAGTLWYTVSEVTTLNTDPIVFTQVSTGSVTSVSITAPAAGITQSGSPITSSGSITLALANDLAGLEGLSTTGIAARTATDTWTTRTLTGTTNRLAVTNGNGVSGNPTFDIDAAYVGQASITTLGTISTGTWSGTTIAVNKGGTGLTTGTSGGILGFTGSTTIASSVALTANALVLGGGAGATPTPMASLGTTSTVLHGNAAGAPTWGAVSLTADVSGTLPIANGGTNITTYTTGDILYASATNTLSKLAIGSTGQILKVVGGVPAWATDAATVTRAFLTGSTATTVDLDTGTSVTDVNGTNTSMTLPADLNNFFVYRNGLLLSRSGAVSPTRDYSVNTGTNEVTFVTALTASESVVFVKFG